MRLRHLAILPLAAALSIGPLLATPADAAGHAAGKSTPAATKKTTPAAKPTSRPQPAKPTKPAKPANAAAPFSATGTLTGVDPTALTVTLLVKGGKDARGTSLTVAVSSTARINLNDTPSTLAALPLGAHVAVSGTTSNTVRTASRINADSAAAPAPTTSQPTTDPTTEPTAEPTA
jgi:hypothetical protein